MDLSILPSMNAGLNATSAILLVVGYALIRQKAITGHTMCMLGACGASTLFLISYLTYHFFHGTTHFVGVGWIRAAYFATLISHTVLAVVIVPLVIITLSRGLRGQFPRHAAIARITFPLWLYVSVTGVIIYWMLYHLYG